MYDNGTFPYLYLYFFFLYINNRECMIILHKIDKKGG